MILTGHLLCRGGGDYLKKGLLLYSNNYIITVRSFAERLEGRLHRAPGKLQFLYKKVMIVAAHLIGNYRLPVKF